MKITLFVCLFISVLGFGQTSFNVFFDLNSSQLRWNDVLKFKELVMDESFQKSTIQLIGHTDSSGSNDYNLELSKKRVNSVKDFLLDAGIKEENIETSYVGEQQATNNNQFYNRRVEVNYQNKTKPDNLEKFIESLKPELQVFHFDKGEKIEFEGKKGTTVELNNSNLVDENDNPYTGEVKVTLKEYYTKGEMFADKMFTQSDHQTIETGGMVDLNAFDKNGNPLKLSNGTVKLGFPKASDKSFTTFTGERDEIGNINWTRNVPEEQIGFNFDGQSVSIVSEEEAMKSGEEFEYRRILGLDSVSYAKYIEEQRVIQKNENNFYNIIKSSQLGQINCDRFLDEKNVFTVSMKIKVENNGDLEPYSGALIFNNINSILPLTYDLKLNGYKTTMLMPKNQKVKLLIIYKNLENNDVYTAISSFAIKPSVDKVVSLEKSSIKEIMRHL